MKILNILIGSKTDLFHHIGTAGGLAAFTGLLQGGQKHTCQNGDNGNYDQQFNKGETAPYHDMEFTKDADMYYAIQHMRMIMRYDKTRKKYKVNMSDTYNFDKWRRIFTKSGASFANAANNLGLMMQKCGMMIPYKIDLSFYA